MLQVCPLGFHQSKKLYTTFFLRRPIITTPSSFVFDEHLLVFNWWSNKSFLRRFLCLLRVHRLVDAWALLGACMHVFSEVPYSRMFTCMPNNGLNIKFRASIGYFQISTYVPIGQTWFVIWSNEHAFIF